MLPYLEPHPLSCYRRIVLVLQQFHTFFQVTEKATRFWFFCLILVFIIVQARAIYANTVLLMLFGYFH